MTDSPLDHPLCGGTSPPGNGTSPLGIESLSPVQTVNIGRKIAKTLKKGSILALEGGLGAGKTCLVKGIGLGLKVKEEITSPTYTIVSEYQATLKGESLPLYHIDVYRLSGDDDFIALGGEEYLYGNGTSPAGITVIEWSERITATLPKNAIKILIEITGDSSRTIRITGGDVEHTGN